MYNLFSKCVRNSVLTNKYKDQRLLFRLLSSSNSDKSSNNYELGKNNSNDKSIRLPGPNDVKNIWNVLNYDFEADINDMIVRESDVLIIGGGIIGWSAAYFLKLNTTLHVAVLERDPSHTRSASVLGMGAIRQQFSEPENIQMSLYGAEFLRNVKEHLSILDLDPPDIQFHPHGFLTISSEKGFEELKKCFEVQKKLGAKVELLTKNDVKSIWPWMGVEDIGGAIHGYENEGWFDQWQLLNALQRKASSLGVHQVIGEAVGFDFRVGNAPYRADLTKKTDSVQRPQNVLVRLVDGNVQPISFSTCINAGGPWAAEICSLLDQSAGAVTLPVEPRVQHSFVVSPRPGISAPTPGIDCPFIVDYDGLNVRRDRLGGDFIVFLDSPPVSKRSRTPTSTSATAVDNDEDQVVGETGLSVRFDQFETHIRAQLSRRIPSFSSATVRSGWASHLDYNYIDQNLIIGRHPVMNNVLLCNGSSGHGIEHSFAIGRALFELIVYSRYTTIDLTNFSPDRFYENLPVFEKEIF